MKKEKAVFEQQWAGKSNRFYDLSFEVLTHRLPAELFGKKASKKLKKKHVKCVDPKNLRKLTVTITEFQRACDKHFQEEAQTLELKIACFMGLLELVSTIKSLMPQGVQQLLKDHSESFTVCS